MNKFLSVFSICVAAAMPAFAADVAVDQAGQQFSQSSLTLKSGDTIVFTNKDDVTHNIKVINGDDTDDKGLQKPGEIIKANFAKAGSYQVRCGIHPKMKIDVTVQ
ncbi:MAG: hypothetical protein KGJ06_08005 [Pseudomonadota bacterium]|nr:hypothetical protein [Pseudomonadota bacterium]